MMKSETIGKLAEALAKAQSEMDSAEKNSMNPHYKSAYADLDAVTQAVREPLSKHGLSYIQTYDEIDDRTYLYTTLFHVSGEWISSKLRLINGKNDMQGLGSATTYGRRYSLSAIVGISQADDDGEGSKSKDNRGSQNDKKSNPPKTNPANSPIKLVGQELQSKPSFQMEWKKIHELRNLLKMDMNALSQLMKENINKELTQYNVNDFNLIIDLLADKLKKPMADSFDDFKGGIIHVGK